MLRQRNWYSANLLFYFLSNLTFLHHKMKIFPLFAASEVLYFPLRTDSTHFRINVKRMGAAERINAERVSNRSTGKDSSVEEERWQRQRDTRPLMEYAKLWSNKREREQRFPHLLLSLLHELPDLNVPHWLFFLCFRVPQKKKSGKSGALWAWVSWLDS